MKKIIMILMASMTVSVMHGQVAKWLIPPAYNSVHMAVGADLIVTDSADTKALWSLTGRRIASTRNQIFPFVDGMAVSTTRGSGQIAGLFDVRGRFISLTNCNVTHGYPYFSDGQLLVQEGYYFRFVDTKGKIAEGKYTKAYPFSNGYASCFTYKNLLKNKNPYYLLLNTNYEQVPFSFNGKSIEDDDIDFISSVNDEGIAFIISKGKVFSFNIKDMNLSPVMANKSEADLKKQAKIEQDLTSFLLKENDSISVLYAKCGKTDIVEVRFDAFLVPLSIKNSDGEYVYKKKEKPTRTFSSPLKILEEDGAYGIYWEDQEMLPPQFDKVMTCYEDKAFVKLNGKCGVLKIYPDEELRVSINKDNPVNFRHQKFETTIRVDLPKMISANHSRIEVDPESGCDIDLPSCEKKDTEFGNYLQYKCVLNIPQTLPDEMYGDSRNQITYPVSILYDRLVSPEIPVKIKAWHHKYFNVDVNESDISIDQGVLTFVFNIQADRYPDEAVYPITASLQSDALLWDLEKLSETRYKCKVWNISEGTNNIVIQVKEQGCPPASFQFDVTYAKPAPKTSTKPAKKENIVIKKKPKPVVPVSTPTPHLDI